ncbi:MAG: biotin--[acetyl-CoA-carboxylase] ligase [Candidatus Krumholzibacteria bacterium]|nr:biotin--[acetyl-CoA-carboxylase] ligase [Candidatus Krumholzibacteria bacterium]
MKRLFRKGSVARDWFGLDFFQVGPRLLRDSGTLYLLDEVGSTSEFLRGGGDAAQGRLCRWDGWGWKARKRARLEPVTDPVPGMVVVARRQSLGKGRQGRSWDDCGGLHLSVVVPPHRASFAQGFSVWLGLLSVLVLREDFMVDARLKWPNDIMVGRRKLGGILLESTRSGAEKMVVAGLGMNLSTTRSGFPSHLQGVATSTLIETGQLLRPGEVGGRIIARVEQELDSFQEHGWGPYRPALSFLDCLLGQEVHLVSGGRDYKGRAAGIDDHGALLLEDAAGRIKGFSAGDVHLTALEQTEASRPVNFSAAERRHGNESSDH